MRHRACQLVLHPASRECYRNSKHPEYYKEEFARWSVLNLESLKDFRKYKPGFYSEFHRGRDGLNRCRNGSRSPATRLPVAGAQTFQYSASSSRWRLILSTGIGA